MLAPSHLNTLLSWWLFLQSSGGWEGQMHLQPPHLPPVCAGVEWLFHGSFWTSGLKHSISGANQSQWLIEEKRYVKVRWDFSLESQGDLCPSGQMAPRYPSGIYLHSLYIPIYMQYIFPFFNNNFISHVLFLLLVLLFENHQDSCVKSRVWN